MFSDELIEDIKLSEGSIPHMYLDTRGYVTVAVGQLLINSDAAIELPFIHSETKEPATPEAIDDEYQIIKQQTKGKVASYYKEFTNLLLTDEFIDELLIQRLNEFSSGLKKSLSEFDNYPEPAQEALMDMAFNLGINGLLKKFPTMIKHTKNQDWNGCSNECHRRGISDDRNHATESLFIKASESARS